MQWKGNFLRNGACAPCNALTDRRTKCTKTGVCKACEDGWALESGECVPCTDPLCLACSSQTGAHVANPTWTSLPSIPPPSLDSEGHCCQVSGCVCVPVGW